MFTEEKIMDEVKKLQYFYGLKREIRYGESRSDIGESVAEHVYGMHILALYFSKLEDPSHKWDYESIYEMISWHDMDEVETGDTIGYLKTDADRALGSAAMQHVISKSPDIIKEHITKKILAYQNQETVEARFVKAIDKIEPLFQVYNKEGKEMLLRKKTTLDDSRRIKDKYVEPFLYMKQFNEVLNTKMDEEGYFTPSAMVK